MAWPSDSVRSKNWGTETLTDSDLEGQLDLLHTWVNDALDETSGHKHDGTTNEGPQIDTGGLAADCVTGAKIEDDAVGAEHIELQNDTYLTAADAAGTGTVDLIKANASDVPVIPDGAQTATDAAPTDDKGIANKKYVDDNGFTLSTYDSGWFACTTEGTYSKTHNLGTTNLIIMLYFSTASDGSANVDVVQQRGNEEGFHWGGNVTDITTSTFTVQASGNAVIRALDSSGNETSITSGYYRVVAVALD